MASSTTNTVFSQLLRGRKREVGHRSHADTKVDDNDHEMCGHGSLVASQHEVGNQNRKRHEPQ